MAAETASRDAIFCAAVEIASAEDRAAYIARACGDDGALRAQVEKLVNAHFRAGSFLEEPAPAPGVTGPPLPPSPEPPILAEGAGTVVGPYKLLQPIGEGGMGAVFLAEQTRPVRRQVALKLIKPGMDSRPVVARFEAERQALALMDHPNIARVFDGGATESGRPYFVMELVKGVPLTKYCDERLTPRQRLELFMPVCEAVQHAHQKGIIHRDLKPSNVLVALYDGKPVPKVIDFGVAKAAGQQLTDKTLFTEFGSVVGTLEYMSPEQAQLNQLDIDTRSDVYSLGVLLYELLTGTTPLERKRLKGTGLLELLRIIREEEPPRPSARLSTTDELPAIAASRGLEPRKLSGAIRGELDWIAMKALEKDRGRRYESASALAQDVGRCLHDEPVQAHPPGAGYRLRKFLRRHAGPATAVAVVLLALVGGVIGTSWGLVRADQAWRAEAGQRKDAEEQRNRAKESEIRADAARNVAVEAGGRADEARENEVVWSYAADMLLTSQAVTDGPLSRALDLLDAWRPERRGGKDYRGREWHMLRRLCGSPEKTLIGHEGPLRALAWSADGKRLASGGADRVIRVWDAETGRCLHTLIGHSAGVFDLAFSPDGGRLASASADGAVRLWDVETGRERLVLRGHILPVYAVAFHPDGRRLASAGADGVIKVWDAADGAELFTLQGHEAPVSRLQFDAAGAKLASCGVVGGTILWDLDTRKIADRIGENGDFAFTPDLATGVFAFPTGEFGVLDVKAKTIDQGDVGLRGVRALTVDRAARTVAIAGTDDAIHVLDRERAATTATLRGHIGAVRRVILRADARKLASAGDDGAVRVWDLPDPDAPAPYAGFHEHNITAAAFSRDGALLASGDYLGCIAVWDARTGGRQRVLGSHFLRRKSQPVPLEIGTGRPMEKNTPRKSYTHFAAGPSVRDPIVDCYTSVGHGGEVKAVAFTPDGTTLVSAGANDLILWDLASGKPIKDIEHPTLVSSLALSPDGALAATGCWDDVVRVFRVPSGEPVKELEGHADDVMCVAFHPSGKELATGGRDRTVIVWDLESGRVKHRLRRHVNTVTAVLYSPDGKHLLSAGMDGAIHVWNAETGEYEATLHGHTGAVTGLAFSADGKQLVSASDGTADPFARLWLWSRGQFREGALIPGAGGKGPTALAFQPVTGDLLLGRQRLTTFEAKPFEEAPPVAAERIDPEELRTKAPVDDRLKVLGYALVDEMPVWPGGEQGRLRAGRPGGRFLVVATSLPFGRLRLGDADYRRLLDRSRNDPDSTPPLKFGSMLIDPKWFVLSDGGGTAPAAQFVGGAAKSEQDGFEFMPRGVSMLESKTATPQPDDRQLVYLAWEVGDDFSARNCKIRFGDDAPVVVPALVLETLRPGRPFHQASLSFDAGEGDSRLRSNVTRSPAP